MSKPDDMVRTQIYLTEEERKGLASLARESGRTQSDLIREAVDCYLARVAPSRRDRILKEASGIWKTRKDLPSFRELRRSWDRAGRG